MKRSEAKSIPQLTKKKLEKARQLESQGNTTAAVRLYKEVTQFDPRDGYVWLKYADALTDLLRFKEAFGAYEQALEYAPSDKRCFVYARIAILKEQSTGHADAETYYRLAVGSIDQPEPWIEVLYGKNLLIQGKYEEAEAQLTSAAAKISQERGEAYLNLALLYRATEQYVDSRDMVMKLLSIEPGNSDAKKILRSIADDRQDG